MDPSQCSIRRATLEDLPALRGLWDIARLPGLELEKRLTEFQVVARADGVILGAIALRISGHHGLVHSEAFYRAEDEEHLRPLLWQRLTVLARNHGLARFWTTHSSHSWERLGFRRPEEVELDQLPPGFTLPHGAAWLLLRVREEALITGSLQRELELHHAAQLESSERLVRRAKMLKWIVASIAVAFFLAALGLVVAILRRTPRRR